MNGVVNRVFYKFKPIIPRSVQIGLRQQIARYKRRRHAHVWPIDPRSGERPQGWQGWPEKKKFALVLCHDVDTVRGRRYVRELAALEEGLGFRSCFNFVPERYGKISMDLLDALRRRGFGVGVHGLKHDGRLFKSREHFDRCAVRINRYLSEWKTRSFSSPSMQRRLDWMTALEMDSCTSTFDTDPFEPQPDGVGTIFPFIVYQKAPRSFPAPSTQHPAPSTQNLVPSTQNLEPKSFVELPYTLPQDHCLFVILGEKSDSIWRAKLDWIVNRGGMALLNTHPDYMGCNPCASDTERYPVEYYTQFLSFIKEKYGGRYWMATPDEVAQFWLGNMSHHRTGPDLSELKFENSRER